MTMNSRDCTSVYVLILKLWSLLPSMRRQMLTNQSVCQL